MAAEQPDLVMPKHGKSKAWRYYGNEMDNDGKIIEESRVRCRLCFEKIAYSKNMTNLLETTTLVPTES